MCAIRTLSGFWMVGNNDLLYSHDGCLQQTTTCQASKSSQIFWNGTASSHNDHCIVHRCKYWRVWYLWPGESLRNTPSSKGIVTQHLYPFLRNEQRLEEFKDIITSQCGETIPSHQTGLWWTSKMIRLLIYFALNEWQVRNDTLHEKKEKTAREERRLN